MVSIAFGNGMGFSPIRLKTCLWHLILSLKLQAPEDDNDGNEPDVVLEYEQQPSADVIMEDQPSTSAGHRGSSKTPFNRYAKPLSASTPNDDIQIIAEKKQPVKGQTQVWIEYPDTLYFI